MKNYELEAKLTALKNKPITLNGKSKGKLLRWEVKDRLVKLICEADDISVLNEDLDDTLSCISIDTASAPAVVQTSMIFQSGHEIKSLILENIKKVKDDPAFIPQAIEVNSNIKSIIELAKTEVEYLKALTMLNRNVG